jgi:hypothetical protein
MNVMGLCACCLQPGFVNTLILLRFVCAQMNWFRKLPEGRPAQQPDWTENRRPSEKNL